MTKTNAEPAMPESDTPIRLWLCHRNGIMVESPNFGEYVRLSDYQSLECRLALTQTRIAELEKDAARYRWLRENHVITEYGDGYINFRWYNAPMGGGGNLEATLELHRASCDKAIDAALRARP